ncbi:MAG TPA: hemolysin-type protein, partial [Burkholderiales bacterium]|nr:hemolysin-type protein [Burkholderiales bacterium]
MAAESLFGINPITDNPGTVKNSDSLTNDSLTLGNTRASKFPDVLAADFADTWEVLQHKSNTATGFSGTLFKAKVSRPELGITEGEFVLSFRSTEFIDDAARDNQATNALELSEFGWAFGQIADMEKWYDELNSDENLLKGKEFSVTGYSLGAHLATAFNLLRKEEDDLDRVLGTYTFNGAGVGKVTTGGNQPLTTLIENFDRQRKNLDGQQIIFNSSIANKLYAELRVKFAGGIAPSILDLENAKLLLVGNESEQALFVNALNRIKTVMNEIARLEPMQNNGATPADIPANDVEATKLDYQMAVLLAQRDTEALSLLSPFDSTSGLRNTLANTRNVAAELLPRFYDIYGQIPPSAVANSQLHYGAPTPVYIEDQPLKRGNVILKSLGASLRVLPPFWETKMLVENFNDNDFGDTHSLVLLVDSLSVMSAFERLDPNVTLNTMLKIFQ